MRREDGLSLTFVGLDSKVSSPLGVRVPTGTVPDYLAAVDVEDILPPEGTAERLKAHHLRSGNLSVLMPSAKRKKTSIDATPTETIT